VAVLVVMLSDALAPAVTDAGVKAAVAPGGRAVADRVTFCADPEVTAVDTDADAGDPATTEPEAGDTDTEKSLFVDGGPATTSIFAAFQPETLTTGVAP
jgi:hypothetical protein